MCGLCEVDSKAPDPEAPGGCFFAVYATTISCVTMGLVLKPLMCPSHSYYCAPSEQVRGRTHKCRALLENMSETLQVLLRASCDGSKA